MLPQAALNAWAQHAPWPNDLDVEQDLILSRAIIDIANHPLLGDELAFRGGTSLHKLHAEQPWRWFDVLVSSPEATPRAGSPRSLSR